MIVCPVVFQSRVSDRGPTLLVLSSFRFVDALNVSTITSFRDADEEMTSVAATRR